MKKETKTGYLQSDDGISETKLSNSVSVSEQDTSILYMRDQDYAEIYASDSNADNQIGQTL